MSNSTSSSLYYYLPARKQKMIDVVDEEYVSKKRKTGFKGVFRCGKKFKAQIQTNGVQNYLGLFDTEIEAAQAYDAHARIVLGARAKTNFQYDDPGPAHLLSGEANDGTYRGRGKNVKRVYAGVKVRKETYNDLAMLAGRSSAAQYSATPHMHYNSEALGDPTTQVRNLGKYDEYAGSGGADDEQYEEDSRTVPSGDQYDADDVDEPDWRDQIYYWTGLLSFDRLNNVFLWNGSWVGSYTGKPDSSEFLRSSNYFEYKSMPIAHPSSVLADTYLSSQGVLCGAIRPQASYFQGFYLMDNDGSGQLDKYLDKDFYVEFEERLGDGQTAPSSSIVYDVLGKGDSDFGAFILTGVFYADTGLLEMARQYITDEDERASMPLDKLRKHLAKTADN